MTDTLFKEVHYSLGNLIGDIGLGRIGLPDIQRPFVGSNAAYFSRSWTAFQADRGRRGVVRKGLSDRSQAHRFLRTEPMPTHRVTMRQIRETLRLHLQARLSYSEVGRALKVSKSVAGKYITLARVAGVDWDLVRTFSNEDLEARLYRPALPRSSHQCAPTSAPCTRSSSNSASR